MEKQNQDNAARVASCICFPKSTKPTLRSWLWSLAVVVCFVAQVIMNILASESFGSFGGKSNMQLAKETPTFLTPDGLTFSVWSIIYLFQGLFSIYQVIPCFQNSHAGVSRARFWVVVLFLGNCLWLPVFSYKLWWLAFMLMLVMDLALAMIYRTMTINYGVVDQTQSADMMLPSVVLEDRKDVTARLGGSDKLPHALLHPWPVKLLCFTGFSTNLSWLAVASMVNLLVASGKDGFHQSYTVTTNATNLLSPATTTIYVNGSEDFTIMAVCLVAVIACVLAVRNCDVPYALVASWALGGVNRAQTSNRPAGYPEAAQSKSIADWASVMIVVVLIAALIGLVRATFESVRACMAARTHSEDGSKPTTRLHYTDEEPTVEKQ